jgi:sulfur relay (sulfurtransferase) complex TusBCD TusD component (DsrE family)
MTKYLFIESRDPFESRDTTFIEEIAKRLQQRGHEVTVFLVQNGVLAARKNKCTLASLAEAGVTLWADDFSMKERGIHNGELALGIQPAQIETLVEALVQENIKAIWH